MAKREYSNGLQHLKFMQRAKQRGEAARKAEEDAVAADETHWVAPLSVQVSGRKCAVVMEGDPKPGALLGRMSFQNFNASVDKLVEEAEAIRKRRFSIAKERAEATSGAAMNEPLRSESVKEGDVGALPTEDEEAVQGKKLKLGSTNNLTAGAAGREWQGTARNESKPWHGWRGQGDYRMLKPSRK